MSGKDIVTCFCSPRNNPESLRWVSRSSAPEAMTCYAPSGFLFSSAQISRAPRRVTPVTPAGSVLAAPHLAWEDETLHTSHQNCCFNCRSKTIRCFPCFHFAAAHPAVAFRPPLLRWLINSYERRRESSVSSLQCTTDAFSDLYGRWAPHLLTLKK